MISYSTDFIPDVKRMSFSPSDIPTRTSLILFSISLCTLRLFQQRYISNESHHLTELPADVVIPRMVAAAPGEAFALLTKGDSLVKIDPTPSWVRPGTIGFKNSTPAQPLLYGNATTPIFGASSLWIPGQGRVKPPVEDRVYAWFANAKSDDIGGFETEDVSSVVELKFRRGKKTLIRYEDSNPNGWFEQRLVDIEPLP